MILEWCCFDFSRKISKISCMIIPPLKLLFVKKIKVWIKFFQVMKSCTDGFAPGFADFCNNTVKQTIEAWEGVKSHFIEIDLYNDSVVCQRPCRWWNAVCDGEYLCTMIFGNLCIFQRPFGIAGKRDQKNNCILGCFCEIFEIGIVKFVNHLGISKKLFNRVPIQRAAL